MEKIEEQLNSLPFEETPTGVHQYIMRRVNYKRLKPMFFTVFILLALNFIIITMHINNKLIDAEFNAMMSDFFEDFILSFNFISTIIGSFFEIISPAIVLSLALNLGGAIYIGNKIRILKYKNSF